MGNARRQFSALGLKICLRPVLRVGAIRREGSQICLCQQDERRQAALRSRHPSAPATAALRASATHEQRCYGRAIYG